MASSCDEKPMVLIFDLSNRMVTVLLLSWMLFTFFNVVEASDKLNNMDCDIDREAWISTGPIVNWFVDFDRKAAEPAVFVSFFVFEATESDLL